MILTTACAVWLFGTTSTAAWALVRSQRTARRPIATSEPPLLLRPCAGLEPGLERALASSIGTRTACETRFLVADETDPAHDVASRVAVAAHSAGRSVSVVVTRATAANRKADQLARALQHDAHAIVVVADSDVLLSDDVLTDLVAPLLEGSADATWSPPIEIAPTTRADRASQAVLDASLHAFALLSALDPRGMVGKLFAIRRDALDAIGGFGALVDVLGEDMELARRLRVAGYRVSVTKASAESLASGRTHEAVVARYARWLAVIRAQRPLLLASYPLLFAAAPLQLALALIATALEGPTAAWLIAAVLAARWAVASAARLRSARSFDGLGLAPWRADRALLAAFVRAVGSREVYWRGVPVRIEPSGTLAEVKR